MTRPRLITLTLLLLSALGATAADSADGTLAGQTPCAPDAAGVRDQHAASGFECYRITYMSDGLKVGGYLWKPRHREGARMPAVIFNRGGNRERSKLTAWMAGGFFDFLAEGFVVIASQYRGVDGGEGTEEYGGADVHDVLALFPLARSLGYIDMDNVFMFGHSRGGMMTYLALKAQAPVRAAAVSAGVADLVGNALDHPDLVTTIYEQLIPDFKLRREEAMRERSVVSWPDKINIPLLLMHGGADAQISAVRTLTLAQKLQALGKPYELIIYANDDHGLSRNRHDRDRRVVTWFKQHLRTAAP